MFTTRDMQLHRILAVALLVAVAAPAGAAVTVYTSLAAFQAAAPLAGLATDLESKPVGSAPAFTLGGLSFSSPLNNMYVIGPTAVGTTSPPPPNHMLSANGQEDIFIAWPGFWAYAFGFTLLTNAYTPHTVTLYDASNAVFFTYHPTQAPNSIGFVGFVSDTPITKVHWVAAQGQLQNTALDNFHADLQAAVPTAPSSWGGVKALYR